MDNNGFTITVYRFGTVPQLALEGWDFDDHRLDYESPRALALYRALGADPADEEYSLAAKEGRWGLFGLTITGHDFAVEEEPQR